MAFGAGRAATAIRPCRSPKSTAAWPTNSASCSLSARKTARAALRRWDALMRSNPSSDRASSVVDIQPPLDPRAARPARNGGGGDKSDGRERQAHVPAFALAPACAQVVHHKTLAAPHLGQGLLHRADAANVVGGKLVALPAGLPLAVIEPVDLSFVTTLDRSGFEIVRALPRGHEAIGSDSRGYFDHGQDRMIARRRDDDPGTREAEHKAQDEPAHMQSALPVAAALGRGSRDEGAYRPGNQENRGKRHDRDRAGRRIKQEGSEYSRRARSRAGDPTDHQRDTDVGGEQAADECWNDEKAKHQQDAGGGD